MKRATLALWMRRCAAQTLLLGSLWGCGSAQLPLTRAEQVQLARLGTVLHAEVGLQYDRQAVEGQQADGELLIAVNQPVARPTDRGLCQVDSAAMQATAAKLCATLLPNLRFQAYHNKVKVMFDTYTKSPDGSSSSGVCSRIVEAHIQPTGMQFREQQRWHE